MSRHWGHWVAQTLAPLNPADLLPEHVVEVGEPAGALVLPTLLRLGCVFVDLEAL